VLSNTKFGHYDSGNLPYDAREERIMHDGHQIGSKIAMRLVHIFEMRDGKITREIVFDMGRPV
jgi:hypothetical protein